MPRFVRPFWITADVDGRKNRFKFGPTRKNGGFNMTILQRDNGGISSKSLKIAGHVSDNGEVILEITEGSNLIHKKATRV